MGRSFTLLYVYILIFALTICVLPALSLAGQAKSDTAELRLRNKANTKNSYLKNGFRLAFPTLKTNNSPIVKTSNARPAGYEEKVLTNVQIFPNPVTDQINLKYTISRNAIVTIKVMDVLGNNVLTLLQQRMDPGEQKFTYNINKQLSSGFYFVRVVVGPDAVIKRISVL